MIFTLFQFVIGFGYAQDMVKFQGVGREDFSPNIFLYENSPFWWNPKYDILQRTLLVRPDSGRYNVELQINKSQRLNLWMTGSFQGQSVFVEPGDTLNFTIRTLNIGTSLRAYMHFSGTKAALHNYCYLVDSLFSKEPFFHKIGDIVSYKKEVNNWIGERTRFLQHYVQTHSLSDHFMLWAKIQIENNYVFKLYSPLLGREIQRAALPEDYFKEIDQLPWDNEQLWDYYQPSLLIRFVTCYTEDMWSNFDTIYQNVLQRFTGKTRAYLLSALIGKFAEHQDQRYATSLLAAIKQAPAYVEEPEYLAYIKESEMNYLKIDKVLPDSVLFHTFLKPYGSDDFITLHEALKKYEGKPVYIDFWASWCTWCRLDIAESAEAKQFLKEKGVEWLYLSVDNDEDKWKNAVVEDAIPHNQYLLKGGPKNPLIQYLEVYGYPQYAILNAAHQLKEANAPRPNSNGFPELKKSITNAITKVFTYE